MRPLLFLAGLLAASPALAQQVPGTPGAPGTRGQPMATIVAEPVGLMIAGFDTDGDARVTRAEFEAGLKRSWAGITTPTISFIGYADWAQTWLGDRNALPNPFEVDQDGDNRISFAELTARFEMFFTRFDADKDNVIVRAELLRLNNGVMRMDRKGRMQPVEK